MDETRPLLSRLSSESDAPPPYLATSTQVTPAHGGPAPAVRDYHNSTDSDQDAADLDFDLNGDLDNPQEWPTPYKWTLVALLAMMAFTVTFNCISVVPLAADIVRELTPSGQEAPKLASVLLVTIWELGEAAGPLIIAPLSEMFGRSPVMNSANWLLILATVLAATATSVPTLITARALTGLAVSSNVLNPAIIGDMFPKDSRGSAVSVTFLAPLVGGAVAPAIAAALAERIGWRNVIWTSAVLSAVCEVLFMVCFRETYKVAILRKRRAAKIRAANKTNTQAARLLQTVRRADSDGLCKEESVWKKLRDSMLRPFMVVFGSGVLLILALLGSVTFSFFYVMSVTLPDIAGGIYHLSPATAGMCFLGFTCGSTFGVYTCNRNVDRIYVKLREADAKEKNLSPEDVVGLPEFRLPLSVVGAFILPVAVAGYGWVAQLQLPLPFLLGCCALLGFSAMLTLIPIMAYVVDAFGIFSASAMTGVIVSRCLMGTFLPLAVAPLVENFGYGWGFTVFATLSLCLAPISWLVLRYGAKWRQYSQYSRE